MKKDLTFLDDHNYTFLHTLAKIGAVQTAKLFLNEIPEQDRKAFINKGSKLTKKNKSNVNVTYAHAGPKAINCAARFGQFEFVTWLTTLGRFTFLKTRPQICTTLFNYFESIESLWFV